MVFVVQGTGKDLDDLFAGVGGAAHVGTAIRTYRHELAPAILWLDLDI